MALELTIVTPERQVFTGDVAQVVLPGSEGDFGVLAHHERFLAPLRIGEARIEQDGRVQYAAVTDGFAEVTGERVVVLVDACELAEDIDAARAERARERAERQIREVQDGSGEVRNLQLYEAALQRAIIRIQVARKQSG